MIFLKFFEITIFLIINYILYFFYYRYLKINRNSISKYAFATLTTPSFAMGAIVLGNSLKNTQNNQIDLICLVTPDVNSTWRNILKQWWIIYEVNPYKPMKHFRRSWAKLGLWNLTQYKKIIYLDSDTIVFNNISNLFNYDQLSCVPDPNPPQICNTGVMVIEPNKNIFFQIDQLARNEEVRYGIGDQGTINAFFKKFTPLSSDYNLYRVNTKGFNRIWELGKTKILHYICKKPWKCDRNSECGCGHSYLNEYWWDLYDEACLNKTCIIDWKE